MSAEDECDRNDRFDIKIEHRKQADRTQKYYKSQKI